MWKTTQRAPPFPQTSLTPIDLLASADQGDNRGPVGMAIHDFDHHFRLGHPGTTRSCILVSIPGALRLVEDNHSLHGPSLTLAVVFICEPVNVMNERLHLQLSLSTAHGLALCPVTFDYVSHESLLDDLYQRPIAGQE